VFAIVALHAGWSRAECLGARDAPERVVRVELAVGADDGVRRRVEHGLDFPEVGFKIIFTGNSSGPTSGKSPLRTPVFKGGRIVFALIHPWDSN
jgi:hypothetical protein